MINCLENQEENHLAVHYYQSNQGTFSDKNYLDLRWSAEEKDYLNINIKSIIQLALEDSINQVEKHVSAYRAYDPYASQALSKAVSAFFQTEITPNMLVGVSGVTAALYFLSQLIHHKAAAHHTYSYPDTPTWLAKNNKIISINLERDLDEIENDIRKHQIKLIILDRPNFFGQLQSVNYCLALANILKRENGYLVVDESNANYFSPKESLIHHLLQVDNLIVCRGLSKVYCQGGLRAGMIFFSPSVEIAIKQCAPPMQLSELSILIMQRLLNMGDITSDLRTRIAHQKQKLYAFLQQKGYELLLTHICLPWVLLVEKQGGTVYQSLLQQGILTKYHDCNYLDQVAQKYLRLSIPLSDARMDELLHRLELSNPSI